jgi:hypothetical protein
MTEPLADPAAQDVGTAPRRVFHVLAAVLAVALWLGLSWLVISGPIAAGYATHNPDVALRLQPSSAAARIMQVDRAVNMRQSGKGPPVDPTEKDPSGAMPPLLEAEAPSATHTTAAAERDIWQSQLTAALAHDPLNPRGVRLLAQVAQLEGDHTRSVQLLRIAQRLSLHETYATYHLMRDAVARDDDTAAAGFADILLRTDSFITPLVVPVLTRMAEKPDGAAVVGKLLAVDPPWRSKLLANMFGSMRDARTPLVLMLGLQAQGHPPRVSEINSYLDFLVGKGNYDLAQATWLQFLPAEQLVSAGFLFNGAFDQPAGGAPFNWRLASINGAILEFGTPPDLAGKRALMVDLGRGRVDFSVQQLVVLGPGQYALKGSLAGQITGKRGLKWRVRCKETDAVLGESAQLSGGAKGWVPFEAAITVPDVNCQAQIVSLVLDARSASEQLSSGRLWFANMSLATVGADR